MIFNFKRKKEELLPKKIKVGDLSVEELANVVETALGRLLPQLKELMVQANLEALSLFAQQELNQPEETKRKLAEAQVDFLKNVVKEAFSETIQELSIYQMSLLKKTRKSS